MDSKAVPSYPAYPPPPPSAWAPPPPPPAPAALAPAAARKPLTWASWLKTSLLGLGIFVGVSFIIGALGGVSDYRALGVVGWIGGALVACYVREMRYAKACFAVVGGVFLGIICLDVAVIAFLY